MATKAHSKTSKRLEPGGKIQALKKIQAHQHNPHALRHVPAEPQAINVACMVDCMVGLLLSYLDKALLFLQYGHLFFHWLWVFFLSSQRSCDTEATILPVGHGNRRVSAQLV